MFQHRLQFPPAIAGRSALELWVGFCGAYLLYWAFRAIYRIYWHPLARYPGSALAAASTEWYEWYWNMYQPGALLFEIERLHKQHGPVVRIGANELHVNDPEFFLDITKSGSNFLKEPQFYRGVSFPNAIVGLIDPQEHRTRQRVLAPAFSAARIREYSPRIKAKVAQLCDKLESVSKSSNGVDVDFAFKALTLDIISQIVFGQEFGVVETPGFQHPHIKILREALKLGWISRTFPNLSQLLLNLPEWVSANIFPIPIEEIRRKCRAEVNAYLEDRRQNRLISESKSMEEPNSGSISSQRRQRKMKSAVMEVLLDPDIAKGHVVPSAEKLNEEALMLLIAGNDTTSNAMVFGMYQICRNPAVQKRLEQELKTEYPGSWQEIDFESLKTLPYLTATIKEILRYTHPLPGRLPRVVPAEGYTLYNKYLQPGTIVHTSAYLLNRHPSVWGPDSNAFDPDRWLSAKSSDLEKYVATFYKGARQCLGQDLAWCELYLLLGTVFRRFSVSIHETTDKDMVWRDHMLLLFQGRNFHVALTPKK